MKLGPEGFIAYDRDEMANSAAKHSQRSLLIRWM